MISGLMLKLLPDVDSSLSNPLRLNAGCLRKCLSPVGKDEVSTVGCWLTTVCHPNPMGNLVWLGRGWKGMHSQCLPVDMSVCKCIVSICGNNATF